MRGDRSSNRQANPVAVGLRAAPMGGERLVKAVGHRRPQRPDEGIEVDGEEQSQPHLLLEVGLFKRTDFFIFWTT